MYSASAFAANTFIRSAFAAAFPLFTVQMFTRVHDSIRVVACLPNNSPSWALIGHVR